ncbi:hypothetical protein NL676_034200 [Syzygium grande]|nr:hypothetical protein NL676_034200 [Syzygium grande]
MRGFVLKSNRGCCSGNVAETGQQHGSSRPGQTTWTSSAVARGLDAAGNATEPAKYQLNRLGITVVSSNEVNGGNGAWLLMAVALTESGSIDDGEAGAEAASYHGCCGAGVTERSRQS